MNELISRPVSFEKLMEVIKAENPSPAAVIFNNPVTIIEWDDGTKTIVYCTDNYEMVPVKDNQGNTRFDRHGKPLMRKKYLPSENYNEVFGLLLCVTKKAFGNGKEYREFIEAFCPGWLKGKAPNVPSENKIETPPENKIETPAEVSESKDQAAVLREMMGVFDKSRTPESVMEYEVKEDLVKSTAEDPHEEIHEEPHEEPHEELHEEPHEEINISEIDINEMNMEDTPDPEEILLIPKEQLKATHTEETTRDFVEQAAKELKSETPYHDMKNTIVLEELEDEITENVPNEVFHVDADERISKFVYSI